MVRLSEPWYVTQKDLDLAELRYKQNAEKTLAMSRTRQSWILAGKEVEIWGKQRTKTSALQE